MKLDNPEVILNENSTSSFFSCLNFLKTANRIGRMEHLLLLIFWSFITGIFCFIAKCSLLFIPNLAAQLSTVLTVIMVILCFIKIINLKISRLHDFNCSGWWLFLCMVPLIGALWGLAIFIIPGTKGPNRFGNI